MIFVCINPDCLGGRPAYAARLAVQAHSCPQCGQPMRGVWELRPTDKGGNMELTIAAQEMLDALAETTGVEDLAILLATAEQDAEEQGLTHIATTHILVAMAAMVADPMAPDYDALAEVEPVTQNGDSRGAGGVAG